MATLPVYFFWSEKYKTFVDILKACIATYPNYLEDKSIEIDQALFDKCTFLSSEHHIKGCFIKLEKIYELLNTLPENSYFLTTDVDIIIFPGHPLKELMDLYINNNADIVFMEEAPDMMSVNIGFILIKVCEANRQLYKRALDLAKKDPNGLDQNLIIDALKEYEGTCFLFPSELVGTTSTIIFNEKKNAKNRLTMQKKMMVFHALCDPTKPFENVFMQKIMQYKMLGLPIEFQ